MGIFRKRYNDWGDKRTDWKNVMIAVAIIIGLIGITT
jgi:hypothetical protein